MRLTSLVIVLVLANTNLGWGQDAGPLKVTAGFPGGSVHVDRIDAPARVITFSPADHPGRGWACWWYFKVDGLKAGDTVKLDLGAKSSFAFPDRASFSVDNETWAHTSPGVRGKNRMTYTHKAGAETMWFAWGAPFVLKHAQALVERSAKTSPHARAFELCKSKEGRSVPALMVTQGDAKDKVGIWIHARQHAWEAGSSWVCQGFVDWILSDDPRAEELRKKAVIIIVPIMDVDNVELGAGGKNQDPHDHNRDWSDAPVWNEVKAASKRLLEMAARKELDLFVDLHNPAPNDRQPFFFVPAKEILSPKARGNLEEFLSATRVEMKGPLSIAAKARESGPSYDKNWKRISGNWVASNAAPDVVACCLETSWNTPNSTVENYQRVGRELGLAIARYFRRGG